MACEISFELCLFLKYMKHDLALTLSQSSSFSSLKFFGRAASNLHSMSSLPNSLIGKGFGNTLLIPDPVAFLTYSSSTWPVTAIISGCASILIPYCFKRRRIDLVASYPSIKGILQSIRISLYRYGYPSWIACLIFYTA